MERDVIKALRPIIGNAADIANLHYEIEHSKANILLDIPKQEEVYGKYKIGAILKNGKEAYKFGLRDKEFLRHVVIAGSTGTGKTNTCFGLLSELVKNNKPFLVFDWKKSYRDLLQLEKFKDLIIFTVGNERANPFRFNPLIPPPGLAPDIWLNRLIEVMAHSYFLAEGAISILQRSIDQVYKENGLYSYKIKEYPIFRDVLSELYFFRFPLSSRRAHWLESAKRTIYGLCFRSTGKAFNCSESLNMQDLLERNIIFELDALSHANKVFFTEALLLWIYYYRLHQRQREKFQHAIIIEEAHRLFESSGLKYDTRIDEPVVNIMLREIRELCESVILIVQNPSLLPVTVLSNTYTTISHNLKHKYDINAISSCMQLDYKQSDYLAFLDVGYSIIKLQGRYKRPFLCKIPLVNIQRGITTDFVLRKRFRSCSGDSSENYGLISNRKDNLLVSDFDISKDELDFMISVSKKPFLFTRERYQELRYSTRRGNEVKKNLQKKGMIVDESVQVDKNASVKLSYFTGKGKNILSEKGIRIKELGKGGIKHEYWKNRIKEKLTGMGF
ncbi:ATP-binding protein, partial [Gemmatimonadota bacterium]